MRRARESVPLAGPRVLLACNLVLVLLTTLAVWRYGREQEEEQFLRLVDRTQAGISGEIDLLLAFLRGVLGLFQASQSVEPEEFRAYVAALDVRRDHPGLLGLGYALRLGPDDVPAVEARIRAGGLAEARVWPLPTSEDDITVLYLEPADRGNRRAPGYTMSHETTRRRAMDRARDTGLPVATSVVSLIQEFEPGLPGVIVFLPHYAPGAPVDTVSERREALRGFAVAPIRVRELLAASARVPDELGIRVYDSPDPRGGNLLYESADAPATGSLVSDRRLDVVGQLWTVRYFGREPTSGWARGPPAGVLLAGILFSGLVYRLQALQVRARLGAERDSALLRAGERRYRFLADAMPQIVFTTDAEGRLAYANRRWDTPQIGAQVPRILPIHPDDRDQLEDTWARAIESGSEWSASFRLWSYGDRAWRWNLGRALPQRPDGAATEWVGTLTDIEIQKQAEEAIQREAQDLERRVQARTAELERSVRELENFAAVASHDLQEPLRKIVAFGDRLADALGPDIPPTAADALGRMRRSALRLQQLISDLLTFARVSRAEVVALPVDLDALAAEVRDDLLDGRTDGAVVRLDPLPRACGDPLLLRQLLVNLLENALKFHPPNASPRVRVYSEPAGEEIDEPERDRWFRLLVEDEGIGFDPKYLQRIFQVFQRLHPPGRYEGTGIGLAICQRVVELHGGKITARSSPSAGACFVCTLPRAPAGTTDDGCQA